MILLTIKTSLSLPVCLASQARAQCMAAWVNIQSTLIVCPVILIKALLSSRLGKRSNMTTFLHIFKLLKIPQHSMYMFPCYGVVRASWVGLVTTLTAYVEGGGATHTMSPHSSDCGQCVKLWSCPPWPPGQKSCSAHARGSARCAPHMAGEGVRQSEQYGRKGRDKVQAGARSTRELLRAKHGPDPELHWLPVSRLFWTVLCAGPAVSDWFLIIGVDQSSNEHSLHLIIYLWQSFSSRPFIGLTPSLHLLTITWN